MLDIKILGLTDVTVYIVSRNKKIPRFRCRPKLKCVSFVAADRLSFSIPLHNVMHRFHFFKLVYHLLLK